jgi:tetratricopeptide (TPR) repeat protein
MDSEDAGIYLNLGLWYYKTGDEQESIKMLKKALEMFNNEARKVWVNLGIYKEWIKEDERNAEEGLIARIIVEIRRLLKKVEDMIPNLKKYEPIFPYGCVSRYIGYETNIPPQELLKGLLYWKEK